MNDSPGRTETSRLAAKRLGSQSLFAFAGSIFTLVVGLPLQVYVARVLGASALGQYGLLEGVVNTASGFLNFGVAATALRFIPQHLERSEYGAVRRLLKTGLVLLQAVGLTAYLVMLLAFPVAERVWPDLQGHGVMLAQMGLLLPLGLLLFFLQQALRGFQEIRYMILGGSILQLSVKALATVVAFSAGLMLGGYIAAVLLATCVAIAWMAYGLWRRVQAMPPSDTADPPDSGKDWRRYAAIVYMNSLLGAATGYLDRFLLGIFIGVGSVGVLLVVRQLQQLPLVFNQMLLMVGAPMFSAAHARGDAAGRDHLYVLSTDWLMKLSLPLLVFLFMFAGPVLRLFGPHFEEQGQAALWIILAGQSVNVAFGPVGNVAMMSGLEGPMLRLAAANAVLGAALTAVLAPLFGLTGVAVATTAGTVFINVAVMHLVRRRLALRWWDRRYLGWLAPASAAVLVAGGVLYSGAAHGPVRLAATLIAVYLCFAAVVLLQGINDDERDLFAHLKQRLMGGAVAT